MRIIILLLSAIAVCLIGLGVLLAALPGERIASIAADQVKTHTGRDLTFEGEVGISWYPTLGITTGKLSFGNAEWSDKGPMFTAEKAVIGVDVIAALSGNIHIQKIELIQPDILLEKASDGRGNWELLSAASPDNASEEQGATNSQREIAVADVSIRNGRIRFLEPGAKPFEIDGLNANLKWPDRQGPANISLSLTPADTPVTLDASIASPDALIGGAHTAVTAAVTATKGRISFDGRAGLAPEAVGSLIVDLPDASTFGSALGLSGAPQGPFKAAGDITLTRDMLFSLRNGSVSAFGNTITTQADVALGGAKPKVTAQIAAASLDLSQFAETDSAGTNTEAASSGWSKAPIDASALALMDGTVAFAADAVNLGTLNWGRTRATVSIDNARAVAEITELAAYDGSLTGRVVANNRNGFSASLTMDARQIALEPFLDASAGIDSFTGKADLTTSVLGSGNSVHALMNSLRGDGNVTVGRGTIKGMDLDKLLRGDVTGGTTVFDSLTASWTIDGGVLSNDDLLMSLPRIAATGKGVVGLGTRTMDYVVAPQLRGEDEGVIVVPVKIEGPWDNLMIAPELDKIIKQNFDKELKVLEDKATKEVEKKLGIQSEEGQSTEDALKKKLEQEAVKGILDLLGNN